MPITVIRGDIFTSQCQTLVNPVNTEGVMGAGLALEFKNRFPDMFKKYRIFCKSNMLGIGMLHLDKTYDKWILNFPTKKLWKDRTQTDYLEKSLLKLVSTYEAKGITSIALPMLGAGLGRLSKNQSESIMRKHLEHLPIPVEIYIF